MVNFAKKSVLNTKLFSRVCIAVTCQQTTVLYQTDMVWLSKGCILFQVFELCEELTRVF